MKTFQNYRPSLLREKIDVDNKLALLEIYYGMLANIYVTKLILNRLHVPWELRL